MMIFAAFPGYSSLNRCLSMSALCNPRKIVAAHGNMDTAHVVGLPQQSVDVEELRSMEWQMFYRLGCFIHLSLFLVEF